MEISIIIPTFRPGKYIFECLESIKKQTLCNNDFEVVIVLNGPKYPFYDILQRYIKQSGIFNIQILYTPLKGVSNARNLGLDNVQSRYVVFIDDDDIISANYLEFLYKDVDENKISVCNVKTFIDDLTVLGDDYISKCFTKLKNDNNYNIFKYRGFLSSACCKIIPVKIIGKNRFNSNFSIGEDSLFIFLISNRIKRITLCEENVIYYRRLRDGSATRRTSGIDEVFVYVVISIIAYSRIYFCNPIRYNLLFYLSRLFAIITGVFERLKASN